MDKLVQTRQDKKGEDGNELSIFYAMAFAVVFSFDILPNDFFIVYREISLFKAPDESRI